MTPGDDPSAPAPDLWAEDPSNAWGVVPAWAPQPPATAPTSGDPAHAGPDSWYRSTLPTPSAPPAPPPTPPTYPPAAEWGHGRHSVAPPPGMPTSAVPAPAARPAIIGSAASMAEVAAAAPAGRGPGVRTGVDNWSRPQPAARAQTAEDDAYPRRRDEFGDEPAYGPVLGFTAGWFGIPALFYLIWLITIDGDRQAIVGRQFVASLPWLFSAIVLSLLIAGLLRWAIVGWRVLTLSFAAAVIGAGVTTVAHSLAL